ncbi:MAG: hypothetical protein R2856_32645 [Caldilineaceae bacterium]
MPNFDHPYSTTATTTASSKNSSPVSPASLSGIHVAPGDPGLTLIELFSWMADALLYRANLIPERQRLAFLRLLGMTMRPAPTCLRTRACNSTMRSTTPSHCRPSPPSANRCPSRHALRALSR